MKQFNKNKEIRKRNLNQNKITYIKKLSISFSCLILLIIVMLFTFAKYDSSSPEYTLINGIVTLPTCDYCEQVVNYQMLYDSSLGNASTNQMSSVTGGWVRYSYTGGAFSLGNSCIYATGVGNAKDTNGFGTYYLMSFSGYKRLYMQVYASNVDSRFRYNWWYPTILTAKSFNYSSLNRTSVLYDSSGYTVNSPRVLSTKILYSTDVSSISSGYPAMQYANWGTAGTYKIYFYSAFLAKADNWQELANKAGIEATSINDILTNSQALLSNERAVLYMIYNCTGDFMMSAIDNSTFMSALQSSEYKDLVYDNEHWSKFISIIRG